MRELAPLLDLLLEEAIDECVGTDVNQADRRRIMFEDHGENLGWFMPVINVWVSPYDHRELCEVTVQLFGGGVDIMEAYAWSLAWKDGHQLRTMAEVAEECVAKLRASHPLSFVAYDAFIERQALESATPGGSGKTGSLRI